MADPQKPRKPAGWFSRRHENRDAHEAAVKAYTQRVNENKAPKS